MRNVKSLTGVRGVAAVWVMLYHMSQVGPAIGAHWMANLGGLSEGWSGVDLFFVLSGFVLMWAAGPQFVSPSFGAMGRFFAARFMRVYPLSFVVLILIALLAWADPGFVNWCKLRNADNFSAFAFLRTAFLATRWIDPDGGDWNQPVWSLSAEIVGYAAFPLIAWLMSTCSMKTAAATAVVALAVLATFQISTKTAGINLIGQVSALMRMACCFIAGIATCRLSTSLKIGPRSHILDFASVGVILTIIICFYSKFWIVCLPLGYTIFVFCLSFQRGWMNSILSSNIAVFLGEISFPLYLFHGAWSRWVLFKFEPVHLGQGAATSVLLTYAIGCLISAWLLHQLIERPLHRWARRALLASRQAFFVGKYSASDLAPAVTAAPGSSN